MKNNKKLWIIILVLLLAAACAIGYIVQSRMDNVGEDDYIIYDDEDYDEDDEFYDEEIIDMDEFDNGIEYDEELEGAEISFKDSASEEDFYGTWIADSGHSLFLYGDLELTIEEDGSWHGTIVDEEESGTWTFDGTAVEISSEFFEAALKFTSDGKLIMQEDRGGSGNSEDFLNTVLTKK